MSDELSMYMKVPLSIMAKYSRPIWSVYAEPLQASTKVGYISSYLTSDIISMDCEK